MMNSHIVDLTTPDLQRLITIEFIEDTPDSVVPERRPLPLHIVSLDSMWVSVLWETIRVIVEKDANYYPTEKFQCIRVLQRVIKTLKLTAEWDSEFVMEIEREWTPKEGVVY